MEGLLANPAIKIRVSSLSLLSSSSSEELLNRKSNPRFLSSSFQRSLNLAPLSCINNRDQKNDKRDGSAILSFENSDMINSDEVREWESGKSINDIAAKQGIRIRRSCRPRHPIGTDLTPRNILEKIIWDKEVEVTQYKQSKPLDTVKKSIEKMGSTKDFVGALKDSYLRTGQPALIAEVKKASPSRGVLRENFDPVEVARTYEKNGAACLSILTDEKYFQGSFENLEKVNKAGIKCPLLCKEFVIDTWQIYYARAKGADAILLIAGVLPDLDIKYMLKTCHELGLAALIEVHDEREFGRVLRIDGVQLIGINNRSLETFEVDISNTKNLLEERARVISEKGIIVVGESGLFNPEDIKYVHDAGVKAVLVGESLIKQKDPGLAIRGLFGVDISP